MNFYEDINIEREKIQNCIRKFGWTSDHNLDWFADCILSKDGKPIFVEFSDGTGLLTHKYKNMWRIWSDPLCKKSFAVDKILEFAEQVLDDEVKEVWCDDVSDNIRPALIKNNRLTIGEIYYSLLWPILDMEKYDPNIPGRHFKEVRNARNKLYREHKVQILSPSEIKKEELHDIFYKWENAISEKQDKEDIFNLKYHNAVEDNFRAFSTARVLVVDGRPVGINAGYKVPNAPDRFAGIIGIHDYSLNDLGPILWLEDLGWIKNAGYKIYDMQGSEDDGGLKFKMQFGAKIERGTDAFPITKK